MTDVPIEEQIRAVRRELALRAKLYPVWVARKKLKQADADRELQAMEAVLKTLESVPELERALLGARVDFSR